MEGPSDEINMKGEILNPDGTSLSASDDMPFPALEGIDRGLAGFAFSPIVFSQAGEYSFQIFVHGQRAYKETFVVRQGIVPSVG